MGIRINQNIQSLQAQHSLQASTKKLTSSLEKLSTGLRINKGSDDVVGLLKSESLRSQVRGITASLSNITNAQNVLGVAEGSLSQLTEIAQKIREKAVQAADSTLSANDRTNLTTAISDMLNEYNRLSNGANFDGMKLLDGSFTSKTFQVGPSSGNTISISISDTRSTAIGKVAVFTSATRTAVATGSASVDLGSSASLVVNGISVPATAFSSDGVSNTAGTQSALAYVNAINSVSDQSGVAAKALSNVATLSYTSGGSAMTATSVMWLNGVTISGTAYESTDAGVASFVDKINSISTQTGVTAVQDQTNDKIVLTAADGRNIHVKADSDHGGTAATLIDFFGLSFTAGSANQIGFRGTFKLTAASSFTMTGASLIHTAASATASVDSSTTLSNISVSSAANAALAIDIMDNVIAQLQNRRSDVGSKSIRMEAAQSELQVRQENLASSESSIRDVDVAAETANMTSAQILQQAGVAVLAQANALPQVALSLLQR